jgi:hypothetical protein
MLCIKSQRPRTGVKIDCMKPGLCSHISSYCDAIVASSDFKTSQASIGVYKPYSNIVESISLGISAQYIHEDYRFYSIETLGEHLNYYLDVNIGITNFPNL